MVVSGSQDGVRSSKHEDGGCGGSRSVSSRTRWTRERRLSGKPDRRGPAEKETLTTKLTYIKVTYVKHVFG